MKYEILYKAIERYHLVIEADSKEEAIEKLDDLISSGEILQHHDDSDSEIEIDEVEDQ